MLNKMKAQHGEDWVVEDFLLEKWNREDPDNKKIKVV